MLDRDAKFGLAMSTLAVALTVADTVKAYRNIRRENRKQVEIRENHLLDLAAMRKARETILKRIEDGRYDSNFENIMRDYSREIEFEKIAIRLQQD